MKLFGKKKETKSCCCGENCTSETMQNAENKIIFVHVRLSCAI